MILIFNKMNVLFWFRKSKKKGSTFGTISCRFTVNGDKSPDFTTGVKVEKSAWDSYNQRIRHDESANAILRRIKSKLEMLLIDLENKNRPINAKLIYEIYSGKLKPGPTLLDCYRQYLEYLSKLVKIGERSHSTYRKELFRFNNIVKFLASINNTNISTDQITGKIAMDFEMWAKTIVLGDNDHIQRHLQAIRRVLDHACRSELIKSHNLKLTKFKFNKPKDIVFLEIEQIISLRSHRFASIRLQEVADLFLFQCFTGLDYGDSQSFNYGQHFYTEIKGYHWIKKNRNKGGVEALIPVLPDTKLLLEKYRCKDLLSGDCVKLPKISNQKYNAYLKEIAEILGFKQHLTTHVARKTFGMLMLNEGFSIESVSKMLGHSNIKITQRHYANVLIKRLESEVSSLWGKITSSLENDVHNSQVSKKTS